MILGTLTLVWFLSPWIDDGAPPHKTYLHDFELLQINQRIVMWISLRTWTWTGKTRTIRMYTV